MKRKLAAMLVLGGIAFGPAASHVVADPWEEGWGTTNTYWSGIDGYIRQSGTTHVTQAHSVWIDLSSGGGWLQIGQYQGDWAGGNSEDYVSQFIENRDPTCRQGTEMDFWAVPLYRALQPNKAYYIKLRSLLGSTHQCLNGSQSAVAWAYDFYAGSLDPAHLTFTGYLDAPSAWPLAATEDQQSPLLGTDHHGCTATLTCSDPGYGLHLYSTSTGWNLWTTAIASREYTSWPNPPFLHQYGWYWSFKTCPTSC